MGPGTHFTLYLPSTGLISMLCDFHIFRGGFGDLTQVFSIAREVV